MSDNDPLHLRHVPPGRGITWIVQGWRVLRRRPLTLTSVFSTFALVALVAAVLPVVGMLASTAALPLLSLAYMVMVREQTRGRPSHPMLAWRALAAGGATRWRPLLALCALYAVVMLLVIAWSAHVDDGSFSRLIEAMTPPRTPARQAEIDKLLESDALAMGLWIRFGGVALLSIPFWHAPGLIWWGGQGVMQSLFSSTLGIWRTKAAFTLYLATLTAAMLATSMLIGLLALMTGGRMFPGMLVTVSGVAFAVLFYSTLWFSFDDTFGRDAS